jgi:hypothetical protein
MTATDPHAAATFTAALIKQQPRTTDADAKLYRCTPAGRVLNQRYKETVSVERMQADYKQLRGD